MMSEDKYSKSKKQLSDISSVLHGQKRKLSSVEKDTQELESAGNQNSQALDALLAQTKRLYQQVGVQMPSDQPASQLARHPTALPPTTTSVPSWDSMLAEYDVADRQLSLDDLLTPEVIASIHQRFHAPLQREPWNKGDIAAVFGAALVGIVADFFCAPVGNPLSKALENYGMKSPDNHGSHYVYNAFKEVQNRLRGSGLADRIPWLQRVANIQVTHDNLSIDYKGTHFGGSHHRILSGGHDLLRFLSAIWQIKNGQFIGVRYEHGKAIMAVFSLQSGEMTPFSKQVDWTTAAVLYFLHVLADFFTTTSLPIPGTTILRELPNRELRKFIAQSYQGGLNLRHVVGQAVTPMVTSLILVLYNLLRYRLPTWYKKTVKKEKVQEEAVPGLKLNEMMAVSHTLVAGVNVGRVAVTGDWFCLNIAEALYCARVLLGLALKARRRRCIVASYKRNRLYLDEGWASLEAYVSQPIECSEIHWPERQIVIS
jgi:hypothetical protein